MDITKPVWTTHVGQLIALIVLVVALLGVFVPLVTPHLDLLLIAALALALLL